MTHQPTLVAGAPALTLAPFVVRPLRCPPPLRIDEALGKEVNDRLMSWVKGIGIFAGKLDKIRDSDFGRYAMLCHADTDDPERLLLQGQCLAALFAVDDHFCDDRSLGCSPETVAPRLSFAIAAMDPVYLPRPFDTDLDRQLDSDPVLVGLRAYMKRVEQFCTPSQVARVRQISIAMFVTMAAEGAWRIYGTKPTIAEYLASRQVNSFWPCLVLIDSIGGYEVPANLYSQPEVHRITALASLATTLVNDLYSAYKEHANEVGEFKLPYLLATRHNCTLQQAIDHIADIHDDVMCDYEAAERTLLISATPLLKRYLTGLKAWIAGNWEWHKHSARYQVEPIPLNRTER
ncbi:2-methylisoborneol synthase [Pseudomonas fluorescens]|uniref:Terpene synthase n=1 Tax=Pseudomonas fluorescens TaxID=294 RepID=A0A5E6S3R0_PSEFL|nr:Camphene synthase [Pseudomonas fluorescens]VVM75241.1 2-methylisoborneol synthase [Pseudomonas fluorescens]VVO87604.1 2-methylisoborneol synthase [Pseudomonas fluorescens]